MCHRKRRTGFRTAPQIYKDKLAQRFPKLLLDLLQLLSHALADRHAPHGIRPAPILPADMREAKEVEGLRFAFSSSFPVLFGIPPD
jgi:hypothetical protein